MTVVARLLLTIAAVFLAVNPAMACCFSASGHDTQIVEMSAPPCHGEAASVSVETEASDTDENLQWATCPGCTDCDNTVFASSLTPDGPSLETSSRTDLFVSRTDCYTPPKAFVDRLSTGPPPTQVSTLETPLTLKQQLLI